MLYQDMLTGYLYEVPRYRPYAGPRALYSGLGNPAGFLEPFTGLAEPVFPRFIPVGFQSFGGFHEAEDPQAALPMDPTTAPSGAQAMAPSPAAAAPSPADLPPGAVTPPPQITVLQPAPGAAPAMMPPPAGMPGFMPLYCYCRQEPFSMNIGPVRTIVRAGGYRPGPRGRRRRRRR